MYGYVRVSSRSQNYDGQVESIKEFARIRNWQIVKIFADKQTGATMDRVEFEKMRSTLVELKNPQGIQALVVTKLDRVGRSVIDLVGFSKELADHDIDLVTTLESIDTSTSQGRLFFHMMSALAEYERELIAERTRAGMDKYLANGGRLGRKKMDVDMDEINRLLFLGVPKLAICRKLKISAPTLYARLGEKK